MFVGVDLAWSRNNETGVAILHGSPPRLHTTGLPVDDDAIIDLIPDDTTLVAIDAPLVVPNRTGQRPAEDELRPVYAEYDAGPYPANRDWLEEMCGEVRGETLVDKLRDRGYDHNAEVNTGQAKGIIEVYPHPATIALFDRDTIIPYKKRKNRSKDDVVTALRTYYDHLVDDTRIQSDTLPSFSVTADDTYADIKQFEDILDAVLSAYIAWYLWHNPDQVQVFGSEDKGYITTPSL